MKYRLDNYISYDMDGLARLLFESREYYIYIWLDKDLSIMALQVNHTVNDKRSGRLDSRNLIYHYNRKKGVSKVSNYVKEIFLDIESQHFKDLFNFLNSLDIGDEIQYSLSESESEFFNEMPSSKRHSNLRLRDPKMRRKRTKPNKWTDTFFY